MAESSEVPAVADSLEDTASSPQVGLPHDDENPEQKQGNGSHIDQQPPAEPTGDGPALSKNQQKKLKRRKQWEDDRPARKAFRKEKRIHAKERKREAIRTGDLPADASKQRKVRSVQVPITILIDCQFEQQMNEDENVSMGGQLTRCYSDHRKATHKTYLAVSSFDGFLKSRFEGILSSQHKSWDVKFRQAHFTEVANEAKEWMADPPASKMPGEPPLSETPEASASSEIEHGEVVYLTSDSPHTLQELKPQSTYIIGGIVDKNRHKGICYQRACDHKVKTAKLPIGDYIKLSSRHVLTTNHVHEIILKWLELRDWAQAFMAVIPQRKGGSLKTEVAEPGGRHVITEGGGDANKSDELPSPHENSDEAVPDK